VPDIAEPVVNVVFAQQTADLARADNTSIVPDGAPAAKSQDL
jgi:hypothetical protein